VNNLEVFVEKIEKQVVFFRQVAKWSSQTFENMSRFNNSIIGIKNLDTRKHCGKLGENCV
jgi:predicted enzyme related to lactoylglutathione lyase